MRRLFRRSKNWLWTPESTKRSSPQLPEAQRERTFAPRVMLRSGRPGRFCSACGVPLQAPAGQSAYGPANTPCKPANITITTTTIITISRRRITAGVVSSDFETQPEANPQASNVDGPGFVEVYVPFEQPELQSLAFEAYYNYAPVDEVASSLLWQLVPLVLIPLLILELIHVPLTSSMARRVRAHEADRAALLERTLSVSERERIRIAADLHDGPVQNLAGIGYALDSVASSVPEQYAILMRRIQDTLHEVMNSLRRLMVDLYPPDLSVGELAAIIATLAAPLSDQGIAVTTSTAPLPDLDGDTMTALYRVARESLANVAEHSQANKVDISFGCGDPDGSSKTPTVLLRIIDDGVGVDPTNANKRAEGHMGLKLLQDRVENLGGTLTVRPGPRGGTAVLAELPVARPDAQPGPGQESAGGDHGGYDTADSTAWCAASFSDIGTTFLIAHAASNRCRRTGVVRAVSSGVSSGVSSRHCSSRHSSRPVETNSASVVSAGFHPTHIFGGRTSPPN